MEYNLAKIIKDKLRLEDIVGSYTELISENGGYKCLSPFSNEKTPSFKIDPMKQQFKCFSSGEGGDVFSFIMKIENLNFRGALEFLANKAGVDIDTNDNTMEKGIMETLERATVYYQKHLEITPSPLTYIKNRGITDESIARWRLGYAPIGWSNICTDVFSPNDIKILSGVCKVKEDVVFDIFRNRIIFPYINEWSKVIGFTGRAIDDTQPKYLNSSKSDIFNKSEALYGIHIAASPIRTKDYSILCEGNLDAIAFHQAGFDNAVASSGTGINWQSLIKLRGLSQNIVLALDGDEAGRKAILKTSAILLSMGATVKVMVLEEGKDPLDMYCEKPKMLRYGVNNSLTLVDYLVGSLIADTSNNFTQSANKIKRMILPIIKSSESLLQRESLLRELSKLTDYSVKALESEMDSITPLYRPLDI